MKILLSAYACHPHVGSEAEVGWEGAFAIARLGHEVWVLTRRFSQPAIEAELVRKGQPPNLHFVYYDSVFWDRLLKARNRSQHMYYRIWQHGVLRVARALHARERFDQIHHLSMASVRHPSLLARLDAPFVFGPVAGGERVPWRLRAGLGVRGRLSELVRDGWNLLVGVDPWLRETKRRATRIYVTSPETMALIAPAYRSKTEVQLAIGLRHEIAHNAPKTRPHDPDRLNVLFVASFSHWKGLHLGLKAFARFAQRHSGARLTVVGDGLARRRWQRLADRLELQDSVRWLPWQSRADLPALYREHDLFLYPSMRDSGGLVVLEALSQGTPVVCLELGGPGVIVDNSCGRLVPVDGAGEAEVVAALADTLETLRQSPDEMLRLSRGAVERAMAYSWDRQMRRLYPEVTDKPPKPLRVAPPTFGARSGRRAVESESPTAASR